jgi:hypothetical protein
VLVFVNGKDEGNPAGRLRGSRNKLSEAVICALLRDFSKHGEKAIAGPAGNAKTAQRTRQGVSIYGAAAGWRGHLSRMATKPMDSRGPWYTPGRSGRAPPTAQSTVSVRRTGALVTVTSPPTMRASLRERARPSPVPPKPLRIGTFDNVAAGSHTCSRKYWAPGRTFRAVGIADSHLTFVEL